MKTLSLKLPESLYGDLVSFAEHTHKSRSAVVREALVALFQKEQTSTQADALSLLGDLAGCIEGPADLSTNKAHLDDLGE